MFEHGQIYYPDLFFFLIGAIVLIPIYFPARRYQSGRWKFINTPLIFSATFYIPPPIAINYLTACHYISCLAIQHSSL
jgi:hypothetical protein